tara:strand:- start:576 stop:785 length:210 start_codon:yes stop_codon:yes gene_type:complete
LGWLWDGYVNVIRDREWGMYMMYKCFMVLKIILTEGLGGRICSTCNMLEKGNFIKLEKLIFIKKNRFFR